MAVLAVLVSMVHQPGDVLAAVPAAVVVGVLAVTALRRTRAEGQGLGQGLGGRRAGLALASVVVLCVPHLHLYAVDRAVTAGLGGTAAGLLDAVAVTLAVVLATAAVLLGGGRPVPARPVAAG